VQSDECNRTSTDLKFIFKFANKTRIPIRVRVINDSAIEFSYSNIQPEFKNAVIACRDRRKSCRDDTAFDILSVGCKCFDRIFYCLLHVALLGGVSLHVCFLCIMHVYVHSLDNWPFLFLFLRFQ